MRSQNAEVKRQSRLCILTAQPCNVSYAAAYSLYAQNVSRYAVSWEFAGNNFDALVQYEFENHILQALGYEMRWR